MKKFLSILMCLILSASTLCVEVSAADNDEIAPEVISFVLTDESSTDESETRASGLITTHYIRVSKSGNVLTITGKTACVSDVVKSGFKNLTVERRKNASASWEDYYSYGNVYCDANSATLNTQLSVASGYQYRVTCNHYAKKSLFSTQTISNTSEVIAV